MLLSYRFRDVIPVELITESAQFKLNNTRAVISKVSISKVSLNSQMRP